jgi:hypothetical protein
MKLSIQWNDASMKWHFDETKHSMKQSIQWNDTSMKQSIRWNDTSMKLCKHSMKWRFDDSTRRPTYFDGCGSSWTRLICEPFTIYKRSKFWSGEKNDFTVASRLASADPWWLELGRKENFDLLRNFSRHFMYICAYVCIYMYVLWRGFYESISGKSYHLEV